MMDYALSADQRSFKIEFERFCEERIRPRARETDRAGAVPQESWDDLVKTGFLGFFHPPELGGSSLEPIKQAIALESLAKACASTFWTATISSLLCGKLLYSLCRPKHHQQWLRPIITGAKKGCFALLERGAGSDPGSLRTTLYPDGDIYRLKGEKWRISNGMVADVAVVVARDPSWALGAPAGRGLAYVVVDLNQPGIQREPIEHVGLRGMSWAKISFDEIPVSTDDVMFNADMEKTLPSIEWGQLIMSFCALGVSEAAYDVAVKFCKDRSSFGRSLSHMQVGHSRVADMRTEIDAARLLAYEAVWSKVGGRAAQEIVMMTKVYATEMGVRVADAAMRILAGWAFSKIYDVERLYRDSLGNLPGGLTSDRLRELIACPIVGVDPWLYEPLDWLAPSALTLPTPAKEP
ncbi:MAG: acyl-CoA dehydrogenase [Polyangiales bacterium]